MSIRLLQGNCLDLLAELEAGSVQCVVTSPPYWGLRDYGIPPTVWGGKRGCVHRWEACGTRRRTGGAKSSTLGAYGNNVTDVHVEDKVERQTVVASHGETCSSCGAWRGVLGMEPSPALYVRHMVLVFRAVRRVLRADGTVWLNLGDTYATSGGAGWQGKHGDRANRTHSQRNLKRRSALPEFGLKPKDLCMMPAEVALALRRDGWWLRRDIIWNKPNPMPESVTDRPMTSHEYLFLLTKSERYYYDADAIREPLAADTLARYGRARTEAVHAPGQDPHRGIAGGARPNTNHGKRARLPVPAGWDFGDGAHGKVHRDGRAGISRPDYDERKRAKRAADPHTRPPMTMNDREYHPLGRTKRSVWTIPTSPFPDAHFATFPPALVEPCILAGTSEAGACPKCGAGWVREVERKFVPQDDVSADKGVRGAGEQKPMDESSNWQGQPRGTTEKKTVGWLPGCACGGQPVPAVVLDPFGGAGTTGLVADRLHRHAILMELKRDYVKLAKNRLSAEAPLLTEVT